MNIIKRYHHGFAALIGLIITLLITAILLSLSFNSISSKQGMSDPTAKTILNTTEEKIKNITEQQLMRQKQLEDMVNDSGGS